VNSGQWAVGSGQWAVSGGQWEVIIRRYTVDSLPFTETKRGIIDEPTYFTAINWAVYFGRTG
jgi:hypothetical protein